MPAHLMIQEIIVGRRSSSGTKAFTKPLVLGKAE
jgi:hypothetical protein